MLRYTNFLLVLVGCMFWWGHNPGSEKHVVTVQSSYGTVSKSLGCAQISLAPGPSFFVSDFSSVDDLSFVPEAFPCESEVVTLRASQLWAMRPDSAPSLVGPLTFSDLPEQVISVTQIFLCQESATAMAQAMNEHSLRHPTEKVSYLIIRRSDGEVLLAENKDWSVGDTQPGDPAITPIWSAYGQTASGALQKVTGATRLGSLITFKVCTTQASTIYPQRAIAGLVQFCRQNPS